MNELYVVLYSRIIARYEQDYDGEYKWMHYDDAVKVDRFRP